MLFLPHRKINRIALSLHVTVKAKLKAKFIISVTLCATKVKYYAADLKINMMQRLKEPSTVFTSIAKNVPNVLINRSNINKMTYLANWFFLSIFEEEPFSLFEIPAAAILNSAQWTVGIDDVSWLLSPISTSFPGSLSPRPQEREKRDPGCGWSRDLGDKPKPQGGLFLNKILSTVSVIGRLINFFQLLHCIALRHDLNAT